MLAVGFETDTATAKAYLPFGNRICDHQAAATPFPGHSPENERSQLIIWNHGLPPLQIGPPVFHDGFRLDCDCGLRRYNRYRRKDIGLLRLFPPTTRPKSCPARSCLDGPRGANSCDLWEVQLIMQPLSLKEPLTCGRWRHSYPFRDRLACSYFPVCSVWDRAHTEPSKGAHHVKAFLMFFILLLAAGMAAQQPAAPPAPAGQTAPAKPAPRPKTQAEANDYNAAAAVTGGAASEKAANDFAAKYPQSELRENLYLRAMHEYQTQSQATGMVAMAQKVLELDSDNSVALVLTATALSDQLKDNDPDQQKVKEILTNANLALQTIDTSFVPPVPVSPEQLAAYKNMLKGMAHAALGLTNLKMGNNPGAETELKAAIETNQAQPDPYTYYHLALAQERQKKFPEALSTANAGLKYAGSDAGATQVLTEERDKMSKETGGAAPAK